MPARASTPMKAPSTQTAAPGSTTAATRTPAAGSGTSGSSLGGGSGLDPSASAFLPQHHMLLQPHGHQLGAPGLLGSAHGHAGLSLHQPSGSSTGVFLGSSAPEDAASGQAAQGGAGSAGGGDVAASMLAALFANQQQQLQAQGFMAPPASLVAPLGDLTGASMPAGGPHHSSGLHGLFFPPVGFPYYQQPLPLMHLSSAQLGSGLPSSNAGASGGGASGGLGASSLSGTPSVSAPSPAAAAPGASSQQHGASSVSSRPPPLPSDSAASGPYSQPPLPGSVQPVRVASAPESFGAAFGAPPGMQSHSSVPAFASGAPSSAYAAARRGSPGPVASSHTAAAGAASTARPATLRGQPPLPPGGLTSTTSAAASAPVPVPTSILTAGVVASTSTTPATAVASKPVRGPVRGGRHGQAAAGARQTPVTAIAARPAAGSGTAASSSAGGR